MMKKKFNLSDYDDTVLMHCSTKEEAEIFCDFLDSSGLTWITGKSYVERNNYESYRENTCYRFKRGSFGNLYIFSVEGFGRHNISKILEFSDFYWENDETEESVESLNSFLSEYAR